MAVGQRMEAAQVESGPGMVLSEIGRGHAGVQLSCQVSGKGRLPEHVGGGEDGVEEKSCEREIARSVETVEERQGLWQALLLEKPASQPWCICGDFNVAISPHEKKGGRPFGISEGLELMSFMKTAEVFDVGFSGSSFTWCNNRHRRARIWKRLDRLLVNAECSDLPTSISVSHLARHPSDHAPLKISFASRTDNKLRAFRFLNVWTSKASLLDVIRTAWQREQQGSPMRVLCSKLIHARRSIQEWNKHMFGNIFDASREAEAAVCRAEARLETEGSDVAQFWRQKARVKWLRHGDGNSKFFHAVLRQRRVQGRNAHGAWVETDEDISNEAVHYFSELFSEPAGNAIDLLHVIPSIVTTEENTHLEADPSIEEVRRIIFDMDVLSKLLADRLAPLLPRLVSPQQTGFVKGRNISENYLLAQELFSGIRRSLRGGNVALKLDMAKAYDRVSWLFLGAFQGLKRPCASGRLLGIHGSRGCPAATHLAFVDDVLIFTNGLARALQKIVRVLDLYQQSSGQLINRRKSGYVVHPSVSGARRGVIESITGFPRQHTPIRYLGFPLFFGKSKAAHYGECSTSSKGFAQISCKVRQIGETGIIGSDGISYAFRRRREAWGSDCSGTCILPSLINYGGSFAQDLLSGPHFYKPNTVDIAIPVKWSIGQGHRLPGNEWSIRADKRS
ncbi:uncharacterized protein [Coffea arabica]|uniref:Endonuclease/exonuclease/phosphatase domain-containing protein n=1 Tax=Coffea arabica TaxID=13443 RepID=A0ABM4UFE8_COFAR